LNESKILSTSGKSRKNMHISSTHIIKMSKTMYDRLTKLFIIPGSHYKGTLIVTPDAIYIKTVLIPNYL